MRAWLQARLPIATVHELLSHKTVPLHRHFVWYYLGGIVLTCFTTLVVTGMLLLLYYRPDVPRDPRAPGAHESVQQIVTAIPHGWWVRSIHHWAANLMVMALLVHLFSVLLLKAYRRPREFAWWTGLALLGLTLTSAFTGYLLPWNALSFAATRVGGGIAGAVPLVGPLARQLLLAGPDVTELTLPRFFGLHVVILPMTIGLVIAVHLALVVYHGSSVPPSAQRDRAAGRAFPSVRFWPDFVLRDLRALVLVGGALAAVAFLYPPVVGVRADPLAPTPEGIQPEWYFLSVFKVLKLMPATVLGLDGLQVGVVFFAALALLLSAIPLLDVEPDGTARQRRRAVWLRRALLAAAVVLAWACTTPAVLAILAARVSEGAAAPSAPTVTAAVAIVWLLVGVWIERHADRRPNGAATLFGMTVVSGVIGYTLWGGVGAVPAVVAVAAFGAAMLLIAVVGQTGSGGASRLATSVASLLLVAFLASTAYLGRAHEYAHPAGDVSVPAVQAGEPAVPADRRVESGRRLAAVLVVSAFLLVVLNRRLRLERDMRDSGLSS